MAKGHERHKARQAEVAGLGKELSRRARSKCELCQTSGSLTPTEITPLPTEPNIEWAALLCPKCIQCINSKQIDGQEDHQFLRESVWSETTPVQILAVRLVRQLANRGELWAQSVLDDLYLDPDIEELI